MQVFKPIILTAIIFLFGCAGISQNTRIAQFQSMSEDYSQALRRSEFKTAFQFLDPAIRKSHMDDPRYSKVRVFEHLAKNIKISPDAKEIREDVELQYYFIDRNVLHTANYQELWRYSETRKIWLLETALPIF